MKKNSSLWQTLASFVACGLLLSATSCETKSKKQVTTRKDTAIQLALRAGTYADVIKAALPAFQKATGIICQVQELSEADLYRRIADNAPFENGGFDLCMVDSSWVAEYTAKHMLANLSAYGYDLDDDIIPATKAICYQNDGLYLAPFYGNVTVLLYNTLMIEEAGYTADKIRSLEDLLIIAQTAKKRHNLGFMYRADTNNNIVVDFLPILRSFDGWVVDDHNNPTVATPEFERALTFYLQLIATGRAAPKDDLIAAIGNKSAAMCIGWPGWYTPIRNSAMDYMALSGRYRHEAVRQNANIYGIWALAVPQNSQHKEEAMQLLAYLMDKNVQKESIAKGGVPCRYSSLQDSAVLAKYPQYDAVCLALESGIYRPAMEEWTQFYTILGTHMQHIIADGAPVADTLAKAQRELEEMLAIAREAR